MAPKLNSSNHQEEQDWGNVEKQWFLSNLMKGRDSIIDCQQSLLAWHDIL
jgi:hypothetical protein